MASRYMMTVPMDIPVDKDTLFNEAQEQEHIPYQREVPEVLSAVQFTTEPPKMIISGEKREIVVECQPRHTEAFEIENPTVLVTCA